MRKSNWREIKIQRKIEAVVRSSFLVFTSCCFSCAIDERVPRRENPVCTSICACCARKRKKSPVEAEMKLRLVSALPLGPVATDFRLFLWSILTWEGNPLWVYVKYAWTLGTAANQHWNSCRHDLYFVLFSGKLKRAVIIVDRLSKAEWVLIKTSSGRICILGVCAKNVSLDDTVITGYMIMCRSHSRVCRTYRKMAYASSPYFSFPFLCILPSCIMHWDWGLRAR